MDLTKYTKTHTQNILVGPNTIIQVDHYSGSDYSIFRYSRPLTDEEKTYRESFNAGRLEWLDDQTAKVKHVKQLG